MPAYRWQSTSEETPRAEHLMKETFEAIVFGMRGDAWAIVQRKSVVTLVDGVRWARSSVLLLGKERDYQRFRARVISSTDDLSAEDILNGLASAQSKRAEVKRTQSETK